MSPRWQDLGLDIQKKTTSPTGGAGMTRDELLRESVADKFLRYVRIDTQADESSKSSPSTPGQLVLGCLIHGELRAMGLNDARLEPTGLVYAGLPANRHQAPAVGFLAHLDTVHGVPGCGVKPILHRGYNGASIQLPNGSTLSPEEFPLLRKLLGHDLITSDGTTLLGADDKAGLAEIMTMIGCMLREPDRPHGLVRVAFTPDEEIGRGVDHFDLAGFQAICAYTADGGEAGEFEEENFNAENLRITIEGRSSHTGTARGCMINAVGAAAELIAGLPSGQKPETTDGREGFLHVDGIEGGVERVTMRWLLRDFTEDGLEEKRRLVRAALRLLRQKYPGLRTRLQVTGGYANMKSGLSADPRVSGHALTAITAAGLTPLVRPIRGGTDGARLTRMGLPTPNLFTGGLNAHSRYELVSVQWMEKAVEVLLNLVGLWAEESQ